MQVVHLPSVLDKRFVVHGPAPEGWIWDGAGEVQVRAAEAAPRHAEPAALAALAAWTCCRRRLGAHIEVHDSAKSPYLWRTGLLKALATDPPWSDEVDSDSDVFPLSRVAGGRRVEAISSGVLQTLHVHEPTAVRALGSCVSEIVRNAEEHSESEQPATFAAGWFRNQRRITFAVADTGRGILRALRHKGVATFEDDDASAIEKAIQPHVTGAGRRGVPHAPNNHGIGLHSTLTFVRDCGGEMMILSGNGYFRHGNREDEFGEPASPWKGTLVSVTLRPNELGQYALMPTASLPGNERWVDEAPPGAVVLSPPTDSARFAGDKEWYREHRPRVMETLERGGQVHVDFGAAVYTTQSAIHALLAEPIRILGPGAVQRLTFSRGGMPLRAAVHLVMSYALADHASGA